MLEDLVSTGDLLSLLEEFTGFPVTLSAPDGRNFSKIGSRRICQLFHHATPGISDCCQQVHQHLAGLLSRSGQTALRLCRNGLAAGATPVIIDGHHLGNLFICQFFFSPPREIYFEKLAQRYGFAREPYLQAIREVPIVSRDCLRKTLRFLATITTLVATSGMASLGHQQAAKKLEQRLLEQAAELKSVEDALKVEIAEGKRVTETLLSQQRQLSRLAHELSRAEEQERRRIAVGLHDQIGQPLSLIKMKVDSLQQGDSRAAEHLVEITELLEVTIQDTRSLIFDLSPPILHELGLIAAVEWLVEEFARRYGLHCSLEVEKNELPPINEELRVMLFRAVRELLVNIVKHAQTSRAWISMQREGTRLCIEVRDQGAGFAIQTTRGARCGFGLVNIRERLTLLGGELTIKSAPGKGAAVTLQLPLAADN